MSVPFYHIFDKDSVGQLINPLPLNQILKWAGQAPTAQTEENKPKILFLGIDIQTDFMDNGALGVAGAKQDVIRLSQFLYKHMDKLSKIIVSLDTHEVKQIFHPCWWVDIEGNHPAPYTIIKASDLTEGKWRATVDPALSKNYVRHLEKADKQLCIWPYHCINGTVGATLESQFNNIIHFISLAQNIPLTKINKGNIHFLKCMVSSNLNTPCMMIQIQIYSLRLLPLIKLLSQVKQNLIAYLKVSAKSANIISIN